MAAPPRPELMEELVEEVLLRIPPDDPASLVNAALVCKLWCRLVSSTRFSCRFRKFHRNAPPLLGYIYTEHCSRVRDVDVAPRDTNSSIMPVRDIPLPTAYFVSTTSFHSDSCYSWTAIDARHGRVLLCQRNMWMATLNLSVWDPITDEQRNLPKLRFDKTHGCLAAVTCAATASGNCDHLDCHRRPFLVVMMDIQPQVMNLFIYSSEAGVWSQLPDFKHPNPRPPSKFEHVPSILVGSILYFLVRFNFEIVKYDLATWEVSTLRLPSQFHGAPFRSIVLMTDDDGGLGLAASTNNQLELWSMVPGGDKFFFLRVLDLWEVLPSHTVILNTPWVFGFADCVTSQFLFIRTSNELYNIEINSCQVKKLGNCCDNDRAIVPYVSFCTPKSSSVQ